MAGQRCLDRLARAYLPDAAVSSVGPPGEVAQRAGGITVLDLQARARAAAARRERGAWCARALTLTWLFAGRAAAGLAGGGTPQRGAAQPASAQPQVCGNSAGRAAPESQRLTARCRAAACGACCRASRPSACRLRACARSCSTPRTPPGRRRVCEALAHAQQRAHAYSRLCGAGLPAAAGAAGARGAAHVRLRPDAPRNRRCAVCDSANTCNMRSSTLPPCSDMAAPARAESGRERALGVV
jgi:hypothetical protein